MKTIILNEERLLDAMTKFLTECDTDEFARIAGEFFGANVEFIGVQRGAYFLEEEQYEFTPNENYWGEFGELENEVVE